MGRRLGQHFLTDPSILDRVVDAITPETRDLVVEIGPGKGTLTSRLAPRVHGVIAIEKDERLAHDLEQRIAERRFDDPQSRVTIVKGDALEVDWQDLVVQSAIRNPQSAIDPSAMPYKVIGNIPYNVTSPLIEKALTPPFPSVIVFLVQREFADRLAAPPGSKTYGALTAGVQSVARVERLFLVRAGAFSPPPKVDSAVVRLTPLADPLVTPGQHGAFRAFLAALFSQRRKQLGRSLRTVWGAGKEDVRLILSGLNLDPEARPEVLAPKQLVDLFRGRESLTHSPGGE